MAGYTIYGDGTNKMHEALSNIAAPNHVNRGKIRYSIPPFDGDCNYSEYAKWELKVEMYLVSIHHFSEQERIRAISSAFTGYALTWWHFLCENNETPKTWKMLKQLLRYDYVPTYYSILCDELQFLKQGSKSVKSYFEKLQALMLRCEIDECAETTENRFLHGLRFDIQNILVDQSYTSLSQLFELACMAEKELIGNDNVELYAPIYQGQENSLEKDTPMVPPPVSNILQEFGDCKQPENVDSAKESEVSTVLKLSTHHASSIYAHETKGNDKDATLMQGENSCEGLNLSSNDAIVAQVLVEHFIDIPLSQHGLLVVSCDKEEENNSFLHVPQLVNKIDSLVLEPNICAENRILLPIASAKDELKMLSSLNTLGYIEFDILCNLNCLEKRLSEFFELPCLYRNTYHFIGKYNCNGEYMVNRVYICSNLKPPLAVHKCDQLEGCNSNDIVMPCSSCLTLEKQVTSIEGEHMFLVCTNILQDSIDKDGVHSYRGEDMLQMWTCNNILSHNIVHSHYFGNLVCLHVVQDHQIFLQAQSTPRTAFRQEGEDDEDMTSMHTTMLGTWNRDKGDRQEFSNQEGGPRLIRFESPSWRPKPTRVRGRFGLQEQPALKSSPRSHTDSVFDVLYMVGKLRR